MAVNDFCRLCEVNIRIHGINSSYKLIFDSRDKQENMCSQLSKLGSVLVCSISRTESDKSRFDQSMVET